MNTNKMLFNNATLGKINVKNRIFMAPMTRSRAENQELKPIDIHAKYYQQRASAGLIITEGAVVSPRATGYVHVPGIYSHAQIDGWKKVTKAVHAEGGKIVVQLWHVGRLSHPDFHNGELPVAPSAINPDTDVFTKNGFTKTVTPKALSIEEIAQIIADFTQAGANAMEAGFDGVEIHSSNGYLFHQFFNNCSNQRTDNYGGSIENKTRFLFEVIDALAEKMPVEKIGLRLNPMLHGRLGIMVDEETAKTFDYIVNRLNNYSLAFLHISRPGNSLDEPYFINDVIGHYRKLYKGFLVANGNYNAESAEQEVASGRADAVAFGRPFISNPDLPARILNNLTFDQPDSSTFYTGGEKGYTDYLS